MIKDKRDYLSFLFLLITLFVAAVMIKMHTSTLYNGIPYQANPVFYAIYILLYFDLAIYMFGTGEQYFSHYGIYILTRYRKKAIFYYRFLLLLSRKIIFFSLAKLLICFILSQILFPDADSISKTVLVFYLINTLVEIVLCMLQLILEILFDSRWALCIVIGYYIISIVLTDILYFYNIRNSAAFFFANWGMKYRVDVLNIPYYILVILLLILWIFFIILGQKVVEKKDIL